MKVTVLGSGTSHGIPMLGCDCSVCRSADPHDKRSRSSILIEQGGVFILIDTATDLRFQALRAGIRRLDAILMTHTHADHLHGLDDTRSLTHKKPLGVYGSKDTIDEIRRRFDYVFTHGQGGGGKPNLLLYNHHGLTIEIEGMEIVPVPVKHGDLSIFGYRIGNFAYITDCSGIPEESFQLLAGVRVLIINALRYRRHPTHFSIAQAVKASARIGAKEVWLTHLCHDVSHRKLTDELSIQNNDAERVRPSYDGLEIVVEN